MSFKVPLFLLFFTLGASPHLPLSASPPLLLRGAVHVHSLRSFDSEGTFEQIEAAAKSAGLDFVIMTDHVAAKKPGKEAPLPPSTKDLLWIEGVEVESKKKDHFLVLGGASRGVEWVRGKEIEGIEEAKRKGAAVFLDHLARSKRFKRMDLIDGVEIYNTHADAARPARRLPKLLFLAMKKKKPLEDLWISLLDAPAPEIKIWEKMALQKSLGILGGNDAHQNLTMFKRLLDPYDVSFRFISTYVRTENKSEAAVLKALKEGKAFVAFPILGDPSGFSFDRAKEGLAVRLPPDSAGQIRLIHNGKAVTERDRDFLLWPDPAPGLWRCEVWLPVEEEWKPWIYSNIIRIP